MTLVEKYAEMYEQCQRRRERDKLGFSINRNEIAFIELYEALAEMDRVCARNCAGSAGVLDEVE